MSLQDIIETNADPFWYNHLSLLLKTAHHKLVWVNIIKLVSISNLKIESNPSKWPPFDPPWVELVISFNFPEASALQREQGSFIVHLESRDCLFFFFSFFFLSLRAGGGVYYSKSDFLTSRILRTPYLLYICSALIWECNFRKLEERRKQQYCTLWTLHILLQARVFD